MDLNVTESPKCWIELYVNTYHICPYPERSGATTIPLLRVQPHHLVYRPPTAIPISPHAPCWLQQYRTYEATI